MAVNKIAALCLALLVLSGCGPAISNSRMVAGYGERVDALGIVYVTALTLNGASDAKAERSAARAQQALSRHLRSRLPAQFQRVGVSVGYTEVADAKEINVAGLQVDKPSAGRVSPRHLLVISTNKASTQCTSAMCMTDFLLSVQLLDAVQKRPVWSISGRIGEDTGLHEIGEGDVDQFAKLVIEQLRKDGLLMGAAP